MKEEYKSRKNRKTCFQLERSKKISLCQRRTKKFHVKFHSLPSILFRFIDFLKITLHYSLNSVHWWFMFTFWSTLISMSFKTDGSLQVQPVLQLLTNGFLMLTLGSVTSPQRNSIFFESNRNNSTVD